MTRNSPLTCVGVAGFEPAASSSRTKASAQLVTPATLPSCLSASQQSPGRPTASTLPDAPLTHGPIFRPLRKAGCRRAGKHERQP